MLGSPRLRALALAATVIACFQPVVAVQTPNQSSQSSLDGSHPSQAPNAVPPEPAALSTDQRLTLLEERLKMTLAAKQEETEQLKERIETTHWLIGLFGGFGAVVILFLTIRDAIHRSKDWERQRGIDEIVKETLRLQNTAMGQQIGLNAIQVRDAEEDPAKHLKRVQNVNEVIDIVQKTLAFRLVTEQKVVDAITTIEEQKAERARRHKQKLDSALAILETFKKMNRMQFAALGPEQHNRAIKLVEKVNDLEDSLDEKDFGITGDLLYTCGVIGYYDEDIVGAREFLERAVQCRAPDHEGELATNEAYRKRFAFTHYFRAIIQKNWGDLTEALFEIEQSAKHFKGNGGEFLTPTTKAEILSYLVGRGQDCRSEILTLIERLAELEKDRKANNKELDPNQKRLRNRLLVLLGHTYYVDQDYSAALQEYKRAVAYRPADYYALGAVAQSLECLDDASAREYWERCLNAIEKSGDFAHKRERITRAGIAVLAARAAHRYGNIERADYWVNEARELLRGDLSVDGLTPKFFSPSTKRLVSSEELLKELDQSVPETEERKVA
jgi:tetratricopeptide (TPR) repeat protein